MRERAKCLGTQRVRCACAHSGRVEVLRDAGGAICCVLARREPRGRLQQDDRGLIDINVLDPALEFYGAGRHESGCRQMRS